MLTQEKWTGAVAAAAAILSIAAGGIAHGRGNALEFKSSESDSVKTTYTFSSFDDITLSAWVNVDSAPPKTPPSTYGFIAGFGVLDNGSRGIGLYVTSATQLVCQVRKSTSTSYASAATPVRGFNFGQWYHLTGVRAGGYVILYVDGTAISSNTLATGAINPNAPFGFGARTIDGGTSWQNFLDGRIADVHLWNYALTPAQIQASMNQKRPTPTATGLIGNWPINEGAGPTVYELSTTPADGTINGASWVLDPDLAIDPLFGTVISVQ